MARLFLLAFFCLLAATYGQDDGLFRGQLQDKPILRALLMKNVFGGDGGSGLPALPLARAMMSPNTQTPILRAMLMRQIMQGGTESQPQVSGILKAAFMFRVAMPAIGKKILANLKERRDSERTYNFQVAVTCDCPTDYIDEDGEIKGFVIDLIHEVCKNAGKECCIHYAPTFMCLSHDGTHPTAGEGLLGKGIDACEGWVKMKAREHVVGFTRPYWQNLQTSSFYVKANNPTGFDVADISGQKIGFMSGWAGDHYCLQGIPGYDSLRAENFIYSNNKLKLFESLDEEELNAVFILDQYALKALELGFQKIGDPVECAGSGDSRMAARKDNDLLEWWDETFEEMMENGRYHALCNKARKQHGHKGDIRCVLQ